MLLTGTAATACGPSTVLLTGDVTTNDVVVAPQISGQVATLLVAEGDSVKAGQPLATLSSDELRADSQYYSQSAAGVSSQVATAIAALRYQQQQTENQVRQAEAALAAAEAQRVAAAADVEMNDSLLARTRTLAAKGVEPAQQLDQVRTATDASHARLNAATRQADASRAQLALAQSNAEQNAMRQSELDANQHRESAADAQRAAADVRLSRATLVAPIDGVVDVLAARQGEVLNAGQPVLTLINPDDLWIRADVEETYIDRVTIGEHLTVRLPSGDTMPGTVIYRGVDASFATRRDVSRTKRDIKTFEIRVRVDNRARRLAMGMTAYVILPVGK